MPEKWLKWSSGSGGVVSMPPNQYSRSHVGNVFPCPVRLEFVDGGQPVNGPCDRVARLHNQVDIQLHIMGCSGMEPIPPTYNVLFPQGSSDGPSWLSFRVTRCPWTVQVEPFMAAPSVYSLWMLHVQEAAANGQAPQPYELFEAEYEETDDAMGPTPDESAEFWEDVLRSQNRPASHRPRKKQPPPPTRIEEGEQPRRMDL